MIKIRLAMYGRKKRPAYKIVATHIGNRRDSGEKEQLGYYHPLANKEHQTQLVINMAQVDYWVSRGAQVSPRVQTLINTFKKNAATATAAESAKKKTPKASSKNTAKPSAKEAKPSAKKPETKQTQATKTSPEKKADTQPKANTKATTKNQDASKETAKDTPAAKSIKADDKPTGAKTKKTSDTAAKADKDTK